MRSRAKKDDNQDDIVAALRKMGASVWITSQMGNGSPDLVVGYAGKNYLIEVKDGSKPPSAQKLTGDESKFHDGWGGNIFVVKSVDDAIDLIFGKYSV